MRRIANSVGILVTLLCWACTMDVPFPSAASTPASNALAFSPIGGSGAICNKICPPNTHQDGRSCRCIPNCVQNVLCIQGTHWDPIRCQCVPDQCISNAGGPCGGFTQNPCQCAAGLVCTPNPIPDIPGTCEPRSCCPAGWDMYKCKEPSGAVGLNCHNPQLDCPSSQVCGGGCDFEVSGRCPVCDPMRCPTGQTFDPVLCKCVKNQCVTAADCTGPLPQFCEICADGSTACAHWSCVAGQCSVNACAI